MSPPILLLPGSLCDERLFDAVDLDAAEVHVADEHLSSRIVEDVKAGKQKAVGALIGQAKKTNPNADPAEIRKICLELIAAMD